jgi:tripartite-type tricarboxylate transporter receptor subunit TctC
MKLPRRQFLRLATGTAALPILPRTATALDFPVRPVHIIVGFAPAGATDISARLIGQWLSERLGQQFVVENRPGAGSNIATEAVVRAPADGYTLLVAGQQVQVEFAPISEAIGYIRAGKLRALAVTTATRSPALPDLPTMGDFLPGYEGSGFFGVGAPRNTSSEIINKLNHEINAGLAEPRIRDRLADLGCVPMPMAPADFGKLIANETEKWGKVIKAANIKPE